MTHADCRWGFPVEITVRSCDGEVGIVTGRRNYVEREGVSAEITSQLLPEAATCWRMGHHQPVRDIYKFIAPRSSEGRALPL